jgi:AcrR family transcriptional regulator
MPTPGTDPSSVRGAPVNDRSTREVLLDAAEECFAGYGVAKTTMNDVARRAGLSRPTLYRYFADREAVAVGVVMRRSERLVHRAVAHIARQDSLEDKIVEGLVFLVDRGRRDTVVIDLIGGDSSGRAKRLADSDAAWRVTEQVWSAVLEDPQVRPELRSGPNTRDVLVWLVHAQLALIQQVGERDDAESWRRVRRLIRTFVLPAFIADAARGATDAART